MSKTGSSGKVAIVSMIVFAFAASSAAAIESWRAFSAAASAAAFLAPLPQPNIMAAVVAHARIVKMLFLIFIEN